MNPCYSRGYYAVIHGDHCPRITSSMIVDGCYSLEYARRECTKGFNAAWEELYPTMARLHGPAEELPS